jgi:hypothetical protein
MPKTMKLICLKYFIENISSLSHHITKEKRRKNKFHPIPHHQKNIFWKTKKPQPSYLEKQPNFSLPCHPKTQPLVIFSIPKSKITSPNPTPKTPLEKGETILSSSSHPKKILLKI